METGRRVVVGGFDVGEGAIGKFCPIGKSNVAKLEEELEGSRDYGPGRRGS
ncbi:hypothetical protein CCP2SC5_1030005 [Azospirillaceae bacterium]